MLSVLLVDASVTNKLQSIVETKTSTQSIKSDEISNFEANIISEAMKILVVNEQCSLIKQFSVSSNFSFDCRHKYLPIDFMLKHQSGEEKILTGYMGSKTNELFARQENSDVCAKIRRLIFIFFSISKHLKF